MRYPLRIIYQHFSLLGFQGTLRTHNISIYARYTNPCYADALCRQGANILYIDKFPRFPRSRSRSHFHPHPFLPLPPAYGIDPFAFSHLASRLPTPHVLLPFGCLSLPPFAAGVSIMWYNRIPTTAWPSTWAVAVIRLASSPRERRPHDRR